MHSNKFSLLNRYFTRSLCDAMHDEDERIHFNCIYRAMILKNCSSLIVACCCVLAGATNKSLRSTINLLNDFAYMRRRRHTWNDTKKMRAWEVVAADSMAYRIVTTSSISMYVTQEFNVTLKSKSRSMKNWIKPATTDFAAASLSHDPLSDHNFWKKNPLDSPMS